MTEVDRSQPVTCPNCSTSMDRHGFQRRYGPEIDLDLCFGCHVMWFDRREAVQLSPRGTIDLFKVLHQHGEDPRHALRARMECPRCRRRLSLTQDVGKGGRFVYYNCPADHGRLTPFSEFLKEEQFVRQLTAAEQAQLKAHVKQVQCSGCGAPVDLARGFECHHCGAPLTVLDADAVEKTLRELEAADEEHTVDEAELLVRQQRARALVALQKTRTVRPRRSGGGEWVNSPVDSLVDSIAQIFG